MSNRIHPPLQMISSLFFYLPLSLSLVKMCAVGTTFKLTMCPTFKLTEFRDIFANKMFHDAPTPPGIDSLRYIRVGNIYGLHTHRVAHFIVSYLSFSLVFLFNLNSYCSPRARYEVARVFIPAVSKGERKREYIYYLYLAIDAGRY